MTKQRTKSDGVNPFEKSRKRQEERKAKENALQTETGSVTVIPAEEEELFTSPKQEKNSLSAPAASDNTQGKQGKRMTRREHLQQVREQARQDKRPNPLTDLMQAAAEAAEEKSDEELTSFTMRLSVRDKKILEAYARKQNMSMSGVILTMIALLEKDVALD